MPATHTLVIDQGSHASRVCIYNPEGDLLYQDQLAVATQGDGEGLFEQHGGEILQSIIELLQRIPQHYRAQLAHCGLCTQRSSVIAWNTATGEALSPLISWRDLRGQPLLDQLGEYKDMCRDISGLALSAHYSASKIHWMLASLPGLKTAASHQQLCIAPLASFLIFHLVHGAPLLIDHSNAQRTQLFDIHRLEWSPRLLELFAIEPQLLPSCVPTVYPYGQLKAIKCHLSVVIGDQNAGFYAYPQTDDSALVNLGTGAFSLSKLPEKSTPARLLKSIAMSQPQQVNYITEGTVNGAGNTLSQALQYAPIEALYDKLPLWLGRLSPDSLFINTVSGLGSPWWCSGGPAEFIPVVADSAAPIPASDRPVQRLLLRDLDPHLPQIKHYYVAIVESIVFLLFCNLQRLAPGLHSLYISGGLARLDGLCQKLADLSQCRVIRFNQSEASARGCAWLCQQSLADNASLWQPLQSQHTFYPQAAQALCLRYQQFIGELQNRCNWS